MENPTVAIRRKRECAHVRDKTVNSKQSCWFSGIVLRKVLNLSLVPKLFHAHTKVSQVIVFHVNERLTSS